MYQSRVVKFFLLGLAIIIFASAAYAFAAANTVPGTYAGDGSATISGYVVSNVHYVLAANPANIQTVTFTLDAAAADVRVSLLDGGTYFSCTNSSGMNWSCNINGSVSAANATRLQVIAVQ